MITCVVGSGGKTTLIHKLAKFYMDQGKRVLITTTTHMYKESETLVTDDPEEIIESLNKKHFAFVGQPCDDHNKIQSISMETFHAIKNYADEILIEADGSRGLPLKMPSESEPVILPECDRVIIVSSLTALGKKAGEVIHRLSYAIPVLEIDENTIIAPSHIQTLLRKGYLEPLMDKSFTKEIHINHDSSLYQRALASLLIANIDVSLLDPAWFANKPRLFICGAGHVAKQLAAMASFLDFRVCVMDSREEFANKERFPQAEEIICESFDNLSSHLEEGSFYAVVTPGHQDDYSCVKQILNSSFAYLGMIGSKKKVATTYDRLTADGFSKESLNSIHAPIGLSIGAVTPGEIAVSILAEIIEIKNKKSSASISSELLNTKENGTLCIIIDKTGSAPRGIGSMMLVTENGQIDTLGGGAIEDQVIKDARAVTSPCIKEYNLSSSDASKLGMICGGTNKVLFIPLHEN